MKRLISVILSVLLLASLLSVTAVNAEDAGAKISFKTAKALYAHAVTGTKDADAWTCWQSIRGDMGVMTDTAEKYFFLPSSVSGGEVDIYNGFSKKVTVNGVEIAAGKAKSVSFDEDASYKVSAESKEYTLRFMTSNAEAAVYVNNSNADGKGTALLDYINTDKSLKATATGAIVTPDGVVDNTPINKIKGRGNTTWKTPKKGYTITYKEAVSAAGMEKTRKFSILANVQDDSLSRNRFLYDLSDAVGMPYASDSRYVDFYSNGVYLGAYQLCQKVEVGEYELINDFTEKDYLNEDGSIKKDFPFLCEIDLGANPSEDYCTELGGATALTIKAPELGEKEPGYEEVKKYVGEKMGAFYDATANPSADLSEYADIDSLAKIYIINELGKNWDAGVSSLYFTYKQDENGKYKFYASPVWDYDNSLGNARGIVPALEFYGIDDYEKPTGNWCAATAYEEGELSPNPMSRISQNTLLMKRVKEIWKEYFIPAIDHFSGKTFDEKLNAELYTADKYYSVLSKCAEMNYKSGWPLRTSTDWIADHNSLIKASFDGDTYTVNKYPSRYENTFTGMFDYCRDWLISRAAWMSKEMADGEVKEVVNDNVEDNVPTEPPTEAPTEPAATEPTTPAVAEKSENPVKVGTKTTTVKASKLKKKAQKVKALTIKNAQGKVSCAVKSADKAIKKYIKSITSKGVLTIKKWKKAKKGTYKIKVKITVKGNKTYSGKTVKKTVKVKVN